MSDAVFPDEGIKIVTDEGIVSSAEGNTVTFKWDWKPIESAPENKIVLVVCEYGVCAAENDGGWQSYPCPYDAGDSCISGITHWMPLPTPYI